MKIAWLITAATLCNIAAQAQTPVDTTAKELKGVSVTFVRRTDTEAAIVGQTRAAQGVVSAVGGEEIRRAQDKDAGEAVRRVAGVSVIEDKFVMVRGLSQRYNNVWVNGGAVPSSEADSRAFSFDVIPATQIDRLMVVKSPSPEYPADFSGGFICLDTKNVPSQDAYSLTLGTVFNDQTAGRSFMRKNANDWYTRSHTALADLKASGDFALRRMAKGYTIGLIGAANYSAERRRVADMENNLFGVYDLTHDRSNYLRRSTDTQWNYNQRFGAMLNATLVSPSGNHKYELKNLLNYLTNDRYTQRQGFSAQSNREASAEYFTRRRLTYSTQLTGRHTLQNDDVLDWSGSYAYANRRMPNRRRYLIDDALTEDGTLGLTSSNDINIENTRLDEHIASASVNHRHTFFFSETFEPQLRVGAYTEYRTREYTTNEEMFLWDAAHNTLPADFRRMDLPTLLSDPAYRASDRLYLYEEPHMRNDYKGREALAAAYFAATLPLGKLRIYTGLRYEYNRMALVSNTRDYEPSPATRRYTSHDFFPSLNATWKLAPDHQLRLAYGRSVNRAEFRELSSSVYYDFDLASDVQGNSELRPADIHNLDLRYEFYPARGEMVSLAAFYKRFRNPIEWTYTVAGGTDLIYSYENARGANNYGLELDLRKTLDFIGMKGFSLAANAAWIHSRVTFPKGSRHDNRPMQGQSPYLINIGLFYQSEPLHFTAALLYNRIGKRIIGVGRSEGTTGSEDVARIPDSYEMPRDAIDLTLSKGFGHFDIKVGIRDLLAQKVTYQQFDHNAAGTQIKQTTRQYRPGRNITASVTYKF